MRLSTMPEHWRSPAFLIGLVLALLAALMMVATEVHVAAPITLLICGISLIANSRAAP